METSSELPSSKAHKISAKWFCVALFFVVVSISIVVSYFVWFKATNPQKLLVQTKSGAICGHYLTSFKGNQYEAYQGIPYAKPPIGKRRFQSPEPIEPWSNELQATKVKDKCLQYALGQLDTMVVGSEDCLYLNVFVPTKKKTNGSLPVIFYIHGGFLTVGSPQEAEEQFIIDYDVIFVSTQYRLGVLGFLSTEDNVVSGNMGLKDQSMALRWTYDNIEAFGGDPKKITLLGGSAGGVGTHFHYLSTWSRGLFHAGMSFSGTAFAPWAIVEYSRAKAIAFSRGVNCNQENVEGIVECLRGIPGDVLVISQIKLQMWLNVDYGIFGPVVENISSSIDPFIDDYPSKILEEGRAYDVPWIVGFAAKEGLPLIGYTNDTLEYVDSHWNLLAPVILDYIYTIPKEQHANIAQRVRKHYLGDKPINRESLQELADLIGDRLFAVGIINAAKVQATVNKSPVFLYYYTYRGTYSLSIKYTNSTANVGATHGDDLHLVLKNPKLTLAQSYKDKVMQRLLIKIWISVAYNGVPDIGVNWPSINLQNRNCLDYIHLSGPVDYKLECSDTFAENKFWNSIGFNEK